MRRRCTTTASAPASAATATVASAMISQLGSPAEAGTCATSATWVADPGAGPNHDTGGARATY